MNTKAHLNFHRLPRALVLSTGLLILLTASAAYASAQGTLNLTQIRELRGKEIGRGTNRVPISDLKLYTYRVEALELPQSVKVKLDGRKTTVQESWRITISGERFRVGAMPAVLLIDNDPVAIGIESPDQTEVSFIVFNPRFIHNGATMGITYGGDLLIDSRDPELVAADFTLPGVDGAQKHFLPETMTIKEK